MAICQSSAPIGLAIFWNRIRAGTRKRTFRFFFIQLSQGNLADTVSSFRLIWIAMTLAVALILSRYIVLILMWQDFSITTMTC